MIFRHYYSYFLLNIQNIIFLFKVFSNKYKETYYNITKSIMKISFLIIATILNTNFIIFNFFNIIIIIHHYYK